MIEEVFDTLLELKTSDFFALLNTALFQDGAFLRISSGTRVDAPIVILNITSSNSESVISTPRLLVIADKNSSASVMEIHASAPGEKINLSCPVTEILVRRNARIRHVRVQNEKKSIHIGRVFSSQKKDSSLDTFSIVPGAFMTRNDISVLHEEPGAEVGMYGFYMGSGDDRVDHHTLIEHRSPSTKSFELYKGILDDRSRATFQGRVHVHRDAQKIDSKQSNHNLVLSDEARVNTMPQLEIYADDVRCTHGATTGQLDEQALFYLQSRGVPLAVARVLLTHAFARDILDRVGMPFWVQKLEELIFDKLNEDHLKNQL